MKCLVVPLFLLFLWSTIGFHTSVHDRESIPEFTGWCFSVSVATMVTLSVVIAVLAY